MYAEWGVFEWVKRICTVNIGTLVLYTIHKECTVQEPANVIYEQNRRVVGSCIYKV